MTHRCVENQWLELISELMSAPLDAFPAEQLAMQLIATFEARACSFTDIVGRELRAGELWPLREQLNGHRPEMQAWARTRSPEHPVMRFFTATGQCRPMQVVDVPEVVAGPGVHDAWNEMGDLIGCPDQLALPLTLRPGGACSFVLGRADRFGQSEMRLAHLLWRLLIGLDRQVQAIAGGQIDINIATELRLTRRELAVLNLLAEGLTAGAIGRRLSVQDRTVQKHLEHIYAKLGVRDRLSAVLRARSAGMLPGAGSGPRGVLK